MAVSKAEILDAIAGMTVLDLSELIKEMEVKFGVSAAAAAVAVAAPAAAAAAVEEQTEFTVMLLAAGEKKVEAIKVVRAPRASASRKPRIWLMAHRRLSRKASPRPTPKPSRSNLRMSAPRSRSSNSDSIAGWRRCRQPAIGPCRNRNVLYLSSFTPLYLIRGLHESAELPQPCPLTFDV